MKKIIYILIIFLFLGCNSEHDYKDISTSSSFDLKSDYPELTKKMTEKDTIKIWASLSSCMWECYENITLTKSKDSINISLKVLQMMDPEVSEDIKVHVNDTIWGFNQFLSNNSSRLTKTDIRDDYNMRIVHNRDTIKFYTGRLGDLNMFIQDYYTSMIKLKPKNKAYQFLMDVR